MTVESTYRATHAYRRATPQDLENWTLVCASVATLARLLRSGKPVKIKRPKQGPGRPAE